MDHHVGIDVSLERSSVRVVDSAGRVVREAKVASEPEALVALLAGPGVAVARVGLEAGPLSQWLRDGLAAAGHEVVLPETRHVKAALSAMTVKTDRKDARGIARLPRMGRYRPVHRKSVPAQEVRALLVGRKLLQGKLLDIEGAIRGILRGFGLKVGVTTKPRYPARVRELVAGHPMLERIAEPMLRAREALRVEDVDHTRTRTKNPQTNGICERCQRTVLHEFHQVAFRNKICRGIDDLQRDLDAWLAEYDEVRPHRGRWCHGKTPMQTFTASLPLAREMVLQAQQASGNHTRSDMPTRRSGGRQIKSILLQLRALTFSAPVPATTGLSLPAAVVCFTSVVLPARSPFSRRRRPSLVFTSRRQVRRERRQNRQAAGLEERAAIDGGRR